MREVYLLSLQLDWSGIIGIRRLLESVLCLWILSLLSLFRTGGSEDFVVLVMFGTYAWSLFGLLDLAFRLKWNHWNYEIGVGYSIFVNMSSCEYQIYNRRFEQVVSEDFVCLVMFGIHPNNPNVLNFPSSHQTDAPSPSHKWNSELKKYLMNSKWSYTLQTTTPNLNPSMRHSLARPTPLTEPSGTAGDT